MKRLRLIFLFFCGLFTFLCFISYLSGLEAGVTGEGWVAALGFASAALCFALSRYWSSRDKLPDEVSDERNDEA